MLAVISEFNVFGRCFPFSFLLFAFILQENKHSDHIISHHHKQWRWCTECKNFLSIYRSQDSMSRYHFICVCFVRVRFIYQWSVEMAPNRRSKSFNFVLPIVAFCRNWKVFDCLKTRFLCVCLWENVFCVDAVFVSVLAYVHSKIDGKSCHKILKYFSCFFHLSKGQNCQKTTTTSILAFEWIEQCTR